MGFSVCLSWPYSWLPEASRAFRSPAHRIEEGCRKRRLESAPCNESCTRRMRASNGTGKNRGDYGRMVSILLLRDGKLRYDEKLSEIFPDFPDYGKAITVRNLLNHTSGLPDYEDLMEAAEKGSGPLWSPEKQIHDAEVLELLKKDKKGKFA